MEQLFYPKSVVVIGVSERPDNPARIIVEDLFEFRFDGEIFLAAKKRGFFSEEESIPLWTSSEKELMSP